MKYFEWDNEKRELNLKKHGVDFVGAAKIFDDPARIERSSFRKGEERLQTIGMVNGVVISASTAVSPTVIARLRSA